MKTKEQLKQEYKAKAQERSKEAHAAYMRKQSKLHKQREHEKLRAQKLENLRKQDIVNNETQVDAGL